MEEEEEEEVEEWGIKDCGGWKANSNARTKEGGHAEKEEVAGVEGDWDARGEAEGEGSGMEAKS